MERVKSPYVHWSKVEHKVSRFVAKSIFGVSIIVFDSKALAKRVSNFMLVQPDVHMSIRNQIAWNLVISFSYLAQSYLVRIKKKTGKNRILEF